jgi:hypothetical protein
MIIYQANKGAKTMITTVNPKESVKQIRPILKRAFKGVKFTLKAIDNALDGFSAVQISWIGGPTKNEVLAFVEHFHTFVNNSDYMADYRSYDGLSVDLKREMLPEEVAYYSAKVFEACPQFNDCGDGRVYECKLDPNTEKFYWTLNGRRVNGFTARSQNEKLAQLINELDF